MKRSDHLEWAKKRALAYVETGDLDGAISSMISDLGKHEQTKGHPGIDLIFQMRLSRFLDSSDKMRKFIEGFL